ncbi:hypothetical protein AB0I81_24575 [Nonomuraea sp. NPDC050404]
MSRMDVHGTVADGFESVREDFAVMVAKQGGQAGAQPDWAGEVVVLC